MRIKRNRAPFFHLSMLPIERERRWRVNGRLFTYFTYLTHLSHCVYWSREASAHRGRYSPSKEQRIHYLCIARFSFGTTHFEQYWIVFRLQFVTLTFFAPDAKKKKKSLSLFFCKTKNVEKRLIFLNSQQKLKLNLKIFICEILLIKFLGFISLLEKNFTLKISGIFC